MNRGLEFSLPSSQRPPNTPLNIQATIKNPMPVILSAAANLFMPISFYPTPRIITIKAFIMGL
jgi:hypothetical protein